jgi:hypothetical protein
MHGGMLFARMSWLALPNFKLRALERVKAQIAEKIVIDHQWMVECLLKVMNAADLSNVDAGHYLKAAADLSKLFGLYAPERHEHSGPGGGPVKSEYTLQHRAVALGNLIAEVRLRLEREPRTESRRSGRRSRSIRVTPYQRARDALARGQATP